MSTRIQPAIAQLKILVLPALILIGIFGVGIQPAMAAGPCTAGYFCATYEQVPPNLNSPQLVVNQVTHAYTGPGFDYLNYGDLPVGYTSQVTGVSQDGNWWVIPLPTRISPDGIGWVSAAAVSATNVQLIPDWLAHCDAMTYCGYVLAHSPQYVPIKQPAPGAPKLGMAFQ